MNKYSKNEVLEGFASLDFPVAEGRPKTRVERNWRATTTSRKAFLPAHRKLRAK